MSTNIIKNAVVTGGAKRLGRAIAIELARAGWNVAVHYNSSNADDVIAEIKKLGVKAVAIQADLLDMKDVKKLIPQANKELGEITLLVNSASIFEKIRFMETDENTYDTHMDIHVKAAFFLSQAFVVQAKHGGQIINVVDSFTCRNKSTYFAYLLAKKSLRSLSKMLAADLAPKILVNAVFPGAVEEYSSNLDHEYIKQRTTQMPMQRLATGKEITDTVVYLADSTLTGQEIFVDGGEQLL